MRGIMLLSTCHYVTDEPITLDEETDCYRASLALAGAVSVPRANLIAFEEYSDEQIEALRHRLRELENRRQTEPGS